MLRKTLTILSLLGLLLSVGLWGASYFGVGYFADHFSIRVELGQLYVEHTERAYFRYGIHWAVYGFDGFETDWLPDFSASDPIGVEIPLWIPCLVFAALPAYSLSPIYRRRKRKKLGLCLKCGYNLRGLTKPRCPECNTPFDERLLKKDA